MLSATKKSSTAATSPATTSPAAICSVDHSDPDKMPILSRKECVQDPQQYAIAYCLETITAKGGSAARDRFKAAAQMLIDEFYLAVDESRHIKDQKVTFEAIMKPLSQFVLVTEASKATWLKKLKGDIANKFPGATRENAEAYLSQSEKKSTGKGIGQPLSAMGDNSEIAHLLKKLIRQVEMTNNLLVDGMDMASVGIRCIGLENGEIRRIMDKFDNERHEKRNADRRDDNETHSQNDSQNDNSNEEERQDESDGEREGESENEEKEKEQERKKRNEDEDIELIIPPSKGKGKRKTIEMADDDDEVVDAKVVDNKTVDKNTMADEGDNTVVASPSKKSKKKGKAK
jgi:hypothetical protein